MLQLVQFLKRLFGRDSSAPTAEDIARARASKRKPRSSSFRSTGPAPLPEVMGEGHSENDWSEWESSMMELDSQMQSLPESSRVYEKEAGSRYTRPSPLTEEEDTFSKVGKNRDV
jgi:hypothetical protein